MEEPRPKSLRPNRRGAGSLYDTVEVSTVENREPRELARHHVALVQGGARDWSAEVQTILKVRLRLAAAILLAGFLMFLIRNLLVIDFSSSLSRLSMLMHVAVTLVLAFCAVDLCRTCPASNRWLRAKELAIFGVPAIFFLWIQWHDTVACAQHGYLPNSTSTWLMLMFTYALFIPNQWTRAVWVLTSMAIAPLLLLGYQLMTQEVCQAALNADADFVSTTALILALGVVAASSGVKTIGTLRRQAFLGRQIGQYRLRKLLGVGGMGEVYLADHQFMKRPCAIKVIRPERAGDPQSLARFEREVQATSRLSHWNNIDIYDYGRDEGGTFYYVMEFLPGLTLQELVDRFGPLEPARVVHLLLQVCDALEEAHRMGLYHRDIKPANIFAAERGGIRDVAKVLDFGLAKCANNLQGADLTQEGLFQGSPLYMAPEQATGEVASDGRSDLYALGGVAFFLLTGRPPFDVSRPVQAIIAHAKEAPVAPSSLQPDVPTGFDAIVLRCLAKDPSARYADVSDLRADLWAMQMSLPQPWTRAAAEAWWRMAEGDDDAHRVATEGPWAISTATAS